MQPSTHVPVDDLTEKHIYLLHIETLSGDRWIAVEFVAMYLSQKRLILHFVIHAKGTPFEGVGLHIDAAAVELKRSIHEWALVDEVKS